MINKFNTFALIIGILSLSISCVLLFKSSQLLKETNANLDNAKDINHTSKENSLEMRIYCLKHGIDLDKVR